MNPFRVIESQKLLASWCADASFAAKFPLYTDYLKCLANAERLNAVHVYMRPLITQLTGEPHAVRLELVQAICRVVDFTKRTAGSSPVEGLPREFLEKIASPTLREQHRTCPDDAYSYVWPAMLPWSQELSDLPDSWELLDRALQLAPDDAFIIELRAAMRLNHIDFDCHHLPDTLLGPVVYVMDEITQLRALAMRSVMDRQTFYLEQAQHYEAQVQDFSRANPNFDSAWELLS